MNQEKAKEELYKVLKEPCETEILEFKTAEKDYDFKKIGKYFSALSNEANLKSKRHAWLIFGINNKHEIVGTNYRREKKDLQSLKHEISKNLNNISFIDIHSVNTEEGRVVMFEIPPAPQGVPVSFKGHYYARNSESLAALSVSKYEEIRNQIKNNDWSAQVCEGIGLEDLDIEAVDFLREKLSKVKNNKDWKSIELNKLLNRVGLLTDGKVNNTCLLFLGKPEITNKFLTDKNKISWKYRDEKNNIEERLSFDDQTKPFIILLIEIQEKINRFNTFLKDLDLFREDIRQYDEKSIEEVLINAIVHRDWNFNMWVEIIQTPISLTVRNPGVFRADLDKVLKYNQKPEYLNKQLALFLQHLNLMEREGNGLRKVFEAQLKRGVRVYKKENVENRVDIILSGKVENIDFAKNVLNYESDLDIEDLLILDSIASGKNEISRDIDIKKAKEMEDKGIIEIDWHRKICNYSLVFSKKNKITGKRQRFKKLTKTQEEAEIINYLEKYNKGKTRDFMQIFEHKGYTYDMVYNILRRLKNKSIKKEGKDSWVRVSVETAKQQFNRKVDLKNLKD